MSDYTTTPNYGLYKPTVNADEDMWGTHLNANADTLDAALHSIVSSAAIQSVTVATVTGNAITAPAGTNRIVVNDAVNAVNALTVGSGSLPEGYMLRMYFPNGGTFSTVTVSAGGVLTLEIFHAGWSIVGRVG